MAPRAMAARSRRSHDLSRHRVATRVSRGRVRRRRRQQPRAPSAPGARRGRIPGAPAGGRIDGGVPGVDRPQPSRGEGSAIGPSVESLRVFSPEEVLTHLLDPNRTVDARYRLYQIDTSDGGTLTGLVENETEASVTVRHPFGGTRTLPRSQVARLQPRERSLMPEGLEEGLSLQDMADVLQFIRGSDPR